MRIKSSLVLACVLSASAAAQVHAQSAQVFNSKGTQAATFVQFGPSVVCADGSVGTASGFAFISGSDSITHTPGTPKAVSSGAFILIFGYSDSCTGTFINEASGGFSGGYTPPKTNLSSAALSGSLQIQDFSSGASYPMSVNLVFTGSGPTQATRGTFVYHDIPGYTVSVVRGSSISRAAGVTGTIAINGSQPDAIYSSTTLVTNNTAQTTVQKN